MGCVLLIDDDDQVRKLLRCFLEAAGHEVVEAADGKQGVKLFNPQLTDVIVTDLVMPEQDGLETIMALRKAAPGVKIIAISGGGRIAPEGYLGIARKMGALCALEKPIDRDALLAAVDRCLR